MSKANELFRNLQSKFLIFDNFPKENWRERGIIFPANCSHTFAEYEELPEAIPNYNKSIS